jgi:oxidase EvaA
MSRRSLGPSIRKARRALLGNLGLTERRLSSDRHLTRRFDFLLSASFSGSRYHSLDDLLAWLDRSRKENRSFVRRVALEDLERWTLEKSTGNLRHDSGQFFSIEGVSARCGGREFYDLLINQPEVGILGLIVKKVDGIYYALMQAKAEPGNVDGTQIAPTVQATRSNYMRVHGGKLPLFVERFLGRAKRKVIYEGLQSEEGARFWKKNNLNIVLEVGAEELEDLPAEFRWMTLYQLKRLLLKSNVVNISARSVLACLP